MLEELKQHILPLLEENACYLDDLEEETVKGEYHLRFFIDLKEGHIDMDTLVEMSEKIGEKLDELDLIKQEYYLDVSSPGAEKPLKTYEQVVKHVGDYVHVELHEAYLNLHEIEGTLLNVEDQTLTIQFFIKGVKKKLVTPYSNIRFIRLAVKF